MKKFLPVLFLALCSSITANAQKADIVKTGWNIGPLPAVAYDADKGFQLGAILQLFNYGDGSSYPNYDSKLYLEASFFTKGSQLYQVRYDNREIIPGVRWCSSARVVVDKAFDFYGFNGYRTNYNQPMVDLGKKGESFLYSPFYRYDRREALIRSELIGRLGDNLSWEAGIFAYYHKLGDINLDNINKGKEESQKYPALMPTLFSIYKASGVISNDEADGGFSSGARLGMVYDSRNKEGAPSEGIWAEAHISAALPLISEIPYYRYSFTWRQYLPVIDNDVLTFAYRLNYEGTLGDAPFYALPYMTVMGEKNDLEGMGGYNTVRGIMRSRVVGLDMATYNAELRWRFSRFRLGNQNIALALNAFSDGTTVTRGRNIDALKDVTDVYDVLNGDIKSDRLHSTLGAGFRFIMNENFIVAAEYGMPVSHLLKNSPVYNQDGTGAFYINVGYLF